jgi:hypothetical protein
MVEGARRGLIASVARALHDGRDRVAPDCADHRACELHSPVVFPQETTMAR